LRCAQKAGRCSLTTIAGTLPGAKPCPFGRMIRRRDARHDVEPGGASGRIEIGAETAQEAVQQPAASFRTAKQQTPQPVMGCGVVRDDSPSCGALREGKAPPRGVEPLSSD
jgi:hypothetical protein